MTIRDTPALAPGLETPSWTPGPYAPSGPHTHGPNTRGPHDTLDFDVDVDTVDDDTDEPESAEVNTLAAAIFGEDPAALDALEKHIEGLENAPATQLMLYAPSAKDFVDSLAAINIVKSSVPSFARVAIVSGNSRDDPTPFRQSCPNSRYGCEFTGDWGSNISGHVPYCQSTSAEAHTAFLERQSKRVVQCKQCSSSFATEDGLRKHMGTVHTAFVPRTCPDCDDGVLYVSRNKLGTHRSLTHSSFKPMACPVGGCAKPNHIYNQRKHLTKHLSTQHKLKGPYTADYTAPRLQWTPVRCGLLTCTTKTLWPSPSKMSTHLSDVHGIHGEAQEQYLAKGGTGLKPKTCKKKEKEEKEGE